MGRYINLESAGKNRTKLVRLVSDALKELMRQSQIDGMTRDLVAFMSMALLEITKTIDLTVEPWEKRGYWVKADRFRREWSWAEKLGDKLYSALSAEDWHEIAQITAQLAEKLSQEKVPARHRLGAPWTGAWEKFQLLGDTDKNVRSEES